MEKVALDIIHDHILDAILGDQVAYVADRGMMELREHGSFADEPVAPFRLFVGSRAAKQDALDGAKPPVQPLIRRTPDGAH